MKNIYLICFVEKLKDICRASGGRLPDKYELKQVIRDCGGE